ncbi:tRNA wybutosine-synthesizing protein 3 homolog isoform X2 [Eleutherodactylus coqui]|uniref:tRNA wybutosine-synthesizing protein 3 homolog isoform X2 n=1 Tax=Eleutherodactylus coqui TaxID=57060 RepID=UPI003461AD6C
METTGSSLTASCNPADRVEDANCHVGPSDRCFTSPTSESLGCFARWKLQASRKTDLSKKGSVDEDIKGIVRDINRQDAYFTTSSCSGRVVLLDESPDVSAVQKQNCLWLFVTHGLCTKDDVFSGLQKASGDAVLKFEPFVLHVQCRTLQDAQLLAVRSTHCLEVPLSHKAKCLVSEEYIGFLVQTANQKMEENKRRICRFYSCLQSALHKQNHIKDTDREQKPVRPVYTRRRKRRQEGRRDGDQCEDSVDHDETNISLFHDMTL